MTDILNFLRAYSDDPTRVMSKARVAETIAEIERLRTELAALREQYEEAIAANMRRAYELAAERLKGQMQDRNAAERDALRALLRDRLWTDEEIDAALNKGGGDE